jgi:hypothetical protein
LWRELPKFEGWFLSNGGNIFIITFPKRWSEGGGEPLIIFISLFFAVQPMGR